MTLNHTLNRKLQLLLVAIAALATFAHAQDTAPTPQTVEEALHQLSDLAGIVFTGEVIAVRHHEGHSGSSGLVEIDFRIDQAVRGCTTGSIYTLREWAGLWSGGDQRYRVGQRLLMLLHAPGPSGMTSPAGGMDGAIPIRGSATELVPPAAETSATQATATSIAAVPTNPVDPGATAAPPVADLRWIGTRVLRPIVYQAPVAHAATVPAARIATPSQSSGVSDASTAAQQAPVNVVVNMLASWQGTANAAR